MADPITIGLVISTAASVASALLGPKQPDTDTTGPRLGDTGVSSSAYGQGIPINFGTVRVGSNIIWAPPLEEVKTVTETEQGKGGGATATNTTFSYFFNGAMSVGEGVVSKWLRIWANSKLIYDSRSTSEVFFKYPGAKVRFFNGTETQLPDALIEADKGVGNVPGYRGQAYFIYEDLPVKDFGNGTPQFTAEVAYKSTDAFPKTKLWDTDEESGTAPFFNADNPSVIDAESNVLWATEPGLLPTAGAISKVDLFSKAIVNHRLGTGDPGGTWNFRGVQLEVDEDFVYFTATTGGSTVFLYALSKNSLAFVKRGVNMGQAFDFAGGVQKVDNAFGKFILATDTNGAFLLNREFTDGNDPRETGTTPLSPPTLTGGGTLLTDLSGADSDGFFYALQTGNDNIAIVRMIISPKVVGFTIGFRQVVITTQPGMFSSATGVGIGIGLYLDEATQQLVGAVTSGSSQEAVLFRYDIATETVVDTLKPSDLSVTSSNFLAIGTTNYLRSIRGTAGLNVLITGSGASHLREIQISDLTVVSTHSLTEWSANPVNSTSNGFYLRLGNTFIMKDTTVPAEISQFSLDRANRAGEDLGVIVTNLAARAGLAASEIDVTDLTGTTVRGFEIIKRGAVRSAIDRLSLAFLFDAVESDFKIKFPVRGGASAFTIDEDDLGVALNRVRDVPDKLIETRQQEVEVPMQIDLQYIDIDRDYQAGDEHSKRIVEPDPTIFGEELQKIDLPIVLTAQEAKAITDKTLAVAWTARDRQETVLSSVFLEMDPTDVATIVRSGCPNLVVRLIETELGTGLLTGYKSEAEDPVIYSTLVLGTGGTGFPTQLIKLPGQVRLFVMNLPLLKDTHSTNRVSTGPYLAASGTSADFTGAITQISVDSIAFTQHEVFDTAVAFGVVTSVAAANPDPFQFDSTTTITLSVSSGLSKFVSVTLAQLLSGRNAAAWGTPTAGYEIIKFQTVVDNGDGTVTITGLVRARRGTERFAEAGHPAGECLILLNQDNLEKAVSRKLFAVSQLNTVRFYRSIAQGDIFDNSTFTNSTLTGIDLEPYEPVHIAGDRDGGNDLPLTWIRQSRVGGANNWLDGVEGPPLAEDTESYNAFLLNKGSGAEEAQKSVTTPAATFTAAEISTAGYNTTEPINVRVYQVSAQAGQGFPGNATVALDDA